MRERPPGSLRGSLLVSLVWLTAACDSKSEAKPVPPPKASPTVPVKEAPAAPPKATPPAGESAAPTVDLAGLDPSQVKGFERLLDEKPSPCGRPHSLRTSLKTDPKCRRALFAARYVVTLLRAGLLPSEAEEHYDKRFVSPTMGRCDLSAAPIRGNVRAPVTICEFSDFQCPHCKLAGPLLKRLVDEGRDQVRVAFKNFPLSKLHPEASAAAAGAMAAHKQGRFWEFHDRAFQSQEALATADLERYASELKLDVKRWKADLPAAREAVEKDRAEGEKLELSGTPTLYINDRRYEGPLRFEAVKDWVDEELNR